MPVLYTPHFVQFCDSNGAPLSGGKLYTYAAGTTTLKATYTTAAGTVENANPIVLDSAGRATLFISGSYKFSLYDSNDVLVKTTDNITSFTTTGESQDSFFQSFSGDGSTTSFTTSSDLGTDEKLVMVFVDNGLKDHVTNGDFATDTDWTKGSGWSIGSGVATAAGGISTAISQTAGLTINEGQPYVVTMTVTRDAGSVTPSVGGTAGTARSSAGTYSEIIIAGSTQALAFTGSSFTGTLDNVSVKPAASTGFDVLPTSGYTVNGTTLTLAIPPATGTNNIQVWAPSLLAAAAASSAAAAATSASSAATSASNASTSATSASNSATIAQNYSEAFTAASTTSKTIATGSVTITINTGKAFVTGQYVVISSDAAPSTNYMDGQITSYNSTSGDLVVNVTKIGGSGTYADWTIGLSGPIGPTGAAGPAGSGSGDMIAANNLSDVADAATARANLGLKSSSTLDYIDEDDMASNSATKLPTQQSVKAYVDAQVASVPNGIVAWVDFDGTGTPSINQSYNVASITDNGTGDYTINFTSELTDAYYAVSGAAGGATSGNNQIAVVYGNSVSKTAAACRIKTLVTSNGVLTDCSTISVIFVR